MKKSALALMLAMMSIHGLAQAHHCRHHCGGPDDGELLLSAASLVSLAAAHDDDKLAVDIADAQEDAATYLAGDAAVTARLRIALNDVKSIQPQLTDEQAAQVVMQVAEKLAN